MLTKRKEPRSFVSTDSRNIGPIEEGYKDSNQKEAQEQSFHPKYPDFSLPFLLVNEIEPNEFFFFDKRANTSKITVFFLFLYSITLYFLF